MEADSEALEEITLSFLLLAGVEPIHCLPSDWSAAVVWIWCEDDVDNTGMF